jgi:ATP-binding cassette, subfamily B, multidrug efflux pump
MLVAKKPLIFEVFFSRPLWRLFILASSFFATAFGLLAPFLQKEFIDRLIHQNNEDILFYLFASFAALAVALCFSIFTNFLGFYEGIVMQRRLSQKLYDHALDLRTDSLGGKSVGEIVALYATDVPGSTVFLEQSLPAGASIFFPLVMAPAALYLYFDVPLWPLLAMMILIGGISFFMAYRQAKFFFRFKRLGAERVGLVSEWIQNIRTLRILGWVRDFEKRIFKVREVETDNRIAMVTNGQTMNAISSSVTFLLNLTAIASVVYLSEIPITMGTLVSLLWIVGVFLTRPFRQLPWFFTFVFDSWTSLKRIQDFLFLENEEVHPRPQEFLKLNSLSMGSPSIEIRNMNLSIRGEKLLQNINFSLKDGEFVAVVGEVGSGKSLLLLSLLGETNASFDSYRIADNNALEMPLSQLRQFFTFVPQEGFIMSATLRENVAFEYSTDKSKDETIHESLRRCQFDLSVERVEQGLDTEIGERGVNLSGGQKQRVSLARVDYFRSPVLLLDDCLSAVDVDTEEKLIGSLIGKSKSSAWSKRTRLLVTHRLSVLEKADRVIFMRAGRIQSTGTFKDLLKSDEDFKTFVSTVANENIKSTVKNPVLAATAEEKLASVPDVDPETES